MRRSYARPVFASSRGGLAEIIENGKASFLIHPNGSPSLEEILEWIIAAPSVLTDMRDSVLEKAREFSLKRMLDDYIQGYSAAAATARRSRFRGERPTDKTG